VSYRAPAADNRALKLSERERMLCARTPLLAIALLSCCGAAYAQHISYWAGAGLGTFITGGSGDPNWHRIHFLAVSLPGDYVELRALKGSFERSRDIPENVGDDDLDYEGFDIVITRKTTGLPVDLAAGAVRYEEEYHLGYPHEDLGGREFVHRWGPHVSALRSWTVARFIQVWAEADLHSAPYQPQQLMLFLDVGVGVRF
jgi:hypothetical protein